MLSFKDQFRDIQEMVRELTVLRTHNLKFKPDDPQDTFLLMSEGLICIVILERFLRAVLDGEATDRDTIRTLLSKAVKLGLVQLPFADQQDGIARITRVRNIILHGNFEQAAKEEGLATVREFFQQRFAGLVEKTYLITDNLFRQIDAETGRPHGHVTAVNS